MADRTLQLRAQEIIANSPTQITVKEACKRALLERCGDTEAMAEVAASVVASSLSGLRKRTYELPENDQLELAFDLPAFIAVTTPDGDLIVPRSEATTGHARQWVKEGTRHHTVQLERFRRAGRDMEIVDDADDDAGFLDDTRHVLNERKRKQLESGAE